MKKDAYKKITNQHKIKHIIYIFCLKSNGNMISNLLWYENYKVAYIWKWTEK